MTFTCTTRWIAVVGCLASGRAVAAQQTERPAIAISTSPVALEALANTLIQVGTSSVKQAMSLATLGSMGAAGFQPFRAQGWRNAGVDHTKPIGLWMFAPTGSANDKRTRGRPVWRTHIRFEIARRQAIVKTLERLSSVGVIARANRAGVSRFLNIKRRNSTATLKELKRHGVAWIGRLHLPGMNSYTLLIRHKNGQLLIDIIRPFGGAATDPFHPATISQLGHVLPQLPQQETSVTVSSQGLYRYFAMQAAEANNGRIGHRHACSILEHLATNALIATHRVVVNAQPAHLTVSLEHLFRSQQDGFARAQRDLVTVRDRDSPMSGAVSLAFLPNLLRQRAPALLRGPRAAMWAAHKRCGVLSKTLTWMLFWPELLTHYARNIASISPSAALFVGAVREVRFALERLGSDISYLHGGAEVVVSQPAQRRAQQLLELTFGSSMNRERPIRHTTWGRGPIRPFWRQRAETIGLAYPQRNTLNWLLARLDRVTPAKRGIARGQARARVLFDILAQLGLHQHVVASEKFGHLTLHTTSTGSTLTTKIATSLQ